MLTPQQQQQQQQPLQAQSLLVDPQSALEHIDMQAWDPLQPSDFADLLAPTNSILSESLSPEDMMYLSSMGSPSTGDEFPMEFSALLGSDGSPLSPEGFPLASIASEVLSPAPSGFPMPPINLMAAPITGGLPITMLPTVLPAPSSKGDTSSDPALLASGSPGEKKKRLRIKPGEVIDADTAAQLLLKKHQRMQRNRESASLSRKRRKEKLEGLEQQIESVSKVQTEWRMKLEALQRENALLREENSRLRALVQSANTTATSIAKPAVGVTALMVCLLCFGLFFNMGSHPTTVQPGNRLTMVSPLVSRTGRSLKSLDSVAPSTDLVVPNNVHAYSRHRESSPPPTPKSLPSTETASSLSAASWNDTEFAGWIQERLRNKLLEEGGGAESTGLVVPDSTFVGEYPVLKLDEAYRSVLLNTVPRRPDTSYILCTEVQIVSAHAHIATQRLSVVFPSANSRLITDEGLDETLRFVQIDCDVTKYQEHIPIMTNDTVDGHDA